jgi:quercetin dioxygenase-like cupin family protein
MPALPADDLTRNLSLADADGPSAKHIGLVGDTYTITVSGKDTGDRFCVIDMHVPPGGGPGPHRHDFEETFLLLDGEMDVTFRGEKKTVRAGQTINIPSNAPHQFHNSSSHPVRMICICSPAGNDRFFQEVGVPVATRTTPPPKLDPQQMAEFLQKAKAIAPKYHTELLEHA